MKITLFWDNTIWSRKDVYQCSGGTCPHLHKKKEYAYQQSFAPLFYS
jgi:hypothetical protein